MGLHFDDDFYFYAYFYETYLEVDQQSLPSIVYLVHTLSILILELQAQLGRHEPYIRNRFSRIHIVGSNMQYPNLRMELGYDGDLIFSAILLGKQILRLLQRLD
jgi:hypothetical protein